MNHCSIAYTFYETDYRVRRYAEALAGSGNRVDVIALKDNHEKSRGVLNGVNVHRIQKRDFDDSMIMFFEPENPEDMARCIIELHNDPGKAQSLSQNAKQFVAENNWQVKKQIYLDLVDSLVSSTKAHS